MLAWNTLIDDRAQGFEKATTGRCEKSIGTKTNKAWIPCLARIHHGMRWKAHGKRENAAIGSYCTGLTDLYTTRAYFLGAGSQAPAIKGNTKGIEDFN
jgi:hypothetical protein